MFYLFRKMWHYAAGERWKFIICYVFHVLSMGGNLVQPFAFGMAMNVLEVNGIINLRPFLPWALLYIGGFVVFQIFHRSARHFEISASLGCYRSLIKDLYLRLCSIPMKWHMDHHSGDIMSRIRTAGEALEEFGYSQYNFIERLMLSVGPIIILAGINFRIASVSLLIIILNMIVVFKLNNVISRILKKRNDGLHSYYSRLADFISNIRTVMTLGMGKTSGREISSKFNPVYDRTMEENRVNQFRCFVMDLGAIIVEIVAVALYIGLYRKSSGAFLIGNMVMIITYLRQMRDNLFEIGSTFYNVMRWRVAMESAEIIMRESEDSAPSEEKNGFGSFGELRLTGLRHSYDNSAFSLFTKELVLRSDSKIALVGDSGSGKSTLLNVMAGLYPADSFKIFKDGIITDDISILTDNSCMISQDSEIFNNTVLYNITFGLKSDNRMLEDAVQISGFSGVVERLPKGLSTDIREKGVNLSGGEKQRLALARGLYFARNKGIILLDEVTSSVDVGVERQVMESLICEYSDKCIVCSIHRLHLLDMFDTVIVMHEGRIAETGSFRELLRKNGHLKRLWTKYQIEE